VGGIGHMCMRVRVATLYKQRKPGRAAPARQPEPLRRPQAAQADPIHGSIVWCRVLDTHNACRDKRAQPWKNMHDALHGLQRARLRSVTRRQCFMGNSHAIVQTFDSILHLSLNFY